MTAGRSLALLAALGAVGCRGRTDRRHDDGAAGRHDAGVAPLANDASAADALAPESAGTIPADGARDGGVDADPYELATGRPRTLADRVGLYAARADVLIEDALMLTLRERLLLVRGVYPDGERFLPGTEQRIKALLAARCGAVVKTVAGDLDVIAEPIDRIFPLDLIDRASSARCTGLMVDRTVIPGPALQSMLDAAAATSGHPPARP